MSFFVNKMSWHINVKCKMSWHINAKCQMSCHIKVKCQMSKFKSQMIKYQMHNGKSVDIVRILRDKLDHRRLADPANRRSVSDDHCKFKTNQVETYCYPP